MAHAALLTLVHGDGPDAARVESALVDGLIAGDPAALARAYDRHHAAVGTFARRLLGDSAAAEDLVQEVFVALPRAIRRFEGRSSLETFLLGIAIRNAKHFVRTTMRRRAMLERLAREVPQAIADPERGAASRELSDALFRALDTLPLDQRTVFVLAELEERSSSEIGAIVGAEDGTVRARLFHAKRKLRAWFEKEGLG